MASKLTLSIKPEVISRAKRLAAKKKARVSATISKNDLAKAIKKKWGLELGPITRKAFGSVKLPKGKTADDVLLEAMMEKYELNK